MTRPLCDHTEDDGRPCPSWAIDGYDQCVRHWEPGEGPKRLHAPAYTGPYAQSYKLDRPVQDEPTSIPAQPYAAESTPEPETVQTPAENENPDDELVPDDGLGTFYITTRSLTREEIAAQQQVGMYVRDVLANTNAEQVLSSTYDTSIIDDEIERMKALPAPNPPSRRGWRRLFRRIA